MTFDAHAEQQKQQRYTQKMLVGHTCSERISRAFDFRKGREWAYAFSLTWTPGHLALAGDVGEMTLSNHSLRDLIGALEWATHGDIDYLLSKSNTPYREFSAEATFHELVHMANERASYSLKGLRDELRSWRRDRPDVYAWQDPDPIGGFWWSEPVTEWDIWSQDRPAPFAFEKDYPRSPYTGMRQYDRAPEPKAPDGWELWEAMRQELCPWIEREAIFTARGRLEIKDRLESALQDGRHAVVDLIHRMGVDDYYGTEVISPQAILRIECIRHGAWLALRHLQPERTYAWEPANTYRAEFRDAFPETSRRMDAERKAAAERYRAQRAAA